MQPTSVDDVAKEEFGQGAGVDEDPPQDICHSMYHNYMQGVEQHVEQERKLQEEERKREEQKRKREEEERKREEQEYKFQEEVVTMAMLENGTQTRPRRRRFRFSLFSGCF